MKPPHLEKGTCLKAGKLPKRPQLRGKQKVHHLDRKSRVFHNEKDEQSVIRAEGEESTAKEGGVKTTVGNGKRWKKNPCAGNRHRNQPSSNISSSHDLGKSIGPAHAN